MPVGLEIYNPAGSLMLSHNLKNPTLVGSGTVTSVANTANQLSVSQALIEFAGSSSNYVLMAFRPPANFTYLHSYFYNTATGKWQWMLVGDEPVSTVIPYWLFALGAPPLSGYGLEIRNPVTGEITFQSFAKPIRIRDVGSAGGTYDAGRIYAAVMGRYMGSLRWEEGARTSPTTPIEPDIYSLNSYAIGVRGITDGLELGEIHTSDPAIGTATPDYSQERDWGASGLLVIDVTNY